MHPLAVVWHFWVLFLTLLLRTDHWSGVFTNIDELYWAEKFKGFGTFDKFYS